MGGDFDFVIGLLKTRGVKPPPKEENFDFSGRSPFKQNVRNTREVIKARVKFVTDSDLVTQLAYPPHYGIKLPTLLTVPCRFSYLLSEGGTRSDFEVMFISFLEVPNVIYSLPGYTAACGNLRKTCDKIL